MHIKVLATLGPSSLKKDIVQAMESHGVELFRINLSHTPLDTVESLITTIRGWTDVPICLDSEGAQIRNQVMKGGVVSYEKGDTVYIHREPVEGDEHNISFAPREVAGELEKGDIVNVDFNSVSLEVMDTSKDLIIAKVLQGGEVGSNKAADLNREIRLKPITPKDEGAFEIGMDYGVRNYSLSFTNCAEDVDEIRGHIGAESRLISKIESIRGVLNLGEIIPKVDQILIDRGDLSREITIEKIPFIQRRIISIGRSKDTPVYVATNLLENMITSRMPTRAEVNDVASTLLMGASGLVLAAETAIGKHPLAAVEMIHSLINQYERWTPESSCSDIINS